MKNFLNRVYRFGYNSAEMTNKNTKEIRDVEWDSIVKYIPNDKLFLDLGCGTGYSIKRAIKDINCETVGIDPQPMIAGVMSDLIEDANFKIMDEIFPMLYGFAEFKTVVPYKKEGKFSSSVYVSCKKMDA